MSSKLDIIVDQSFQESLETKGFFVVDFLGFDEVNVLRSFFEQNPPELSDTFHTTHFSNNYDYKRKVNDFIIQTIQPAFKKLFTTAYRPIFANYMIKVSNVDNFMPLHADWTYVDESMLNSYSIWIPLVDTSEENGCFGLIPYSQHLSNGIRGPRILQWNYPTNDLLINAMGKLLPIKAGQAIVYNHRVLHYSPANKTATIRPAVNIAVVPTKQTIIHYAIPEGVDEILQFEVDDDNFFIEYDHFQMPSKGTAYCSLPRSASPTFDDNAAFFIKMNADKKGNV